MGRTNPTYRDYLAEFEMRFADYRRGLRGGAKPHFDALVAQAREHADAGHAVGYRNPDVVLLLSVALAHERRLARLEGARESEVGRKSEGERESEAEWESKAEQESET